MSNILVAYFSATGITGRVAQTLSKVLRADTYEIRPEQPYSESDLNWTDSSARSTVESKDPASRPALADHDAPIADHDIIFLGFPIWWHKEPPIIRTFLEAYDFAGKRIIPFATSGSSPLDAAVSEISSLVPAATVESGKLLNWPQNSPAALEKWVGQIGLPK